MKAIITSRLDVGDGGFTHEAAFGKDLCERGKRAGLAFFFIFSPSLEVLNGA